jgi:hypothetical protein
MELQLSEEELTLLRDVLDTARGNLRLEVEGTSTREYKEALQRREAVLVSLIAKTASKVENQRHIGQPGIESASGRDRSKGELPAGFGTDDGTIDISAVAPPPGTVQGTRVGPQGDPTGAEDEGDAR